MHIVSFSVADNPRVCYISTEGFSVTIVFSLGEIVVAVDEASLILIPTH